MKVCVCVFLLVLFDGFCWFFEGLVVFVGVFFWVERVVGLEVSVLFGFVALECFFVWVLLAWKKDKVLV